MLIFQLLFSLLLLSLLLLLGSLGLLIFPYYTCFLRTACIVSYLSNVDICNTSKLCEYASLDNAELLNIARCSNGCLVLKWCHDEPASVASSPSGVSISNMPPLF